MTLGTITKTASLLVSPEAQDELLLGLNFPSTCGITKSHIDGLRAAIEEVFKKYESISIFNELPFIEVERYINNMILKLRPKSRNRTVYTVLSVYFKTSHKINFKQKLKILNFKVFIQALHKQFTLMV